MKKLSPFKIVFVFVLLSGLWIAFSDILLLRIVPDPQLLTKFSIAKGFLYIVVTAVFLYTLIRQYASQRDSTEASLGENRAMLANILDTIPQSVFWKDRDSVYLGCNSVFARAAGLESPEQIIGKSDFDLPWPREEAEAYRADDREVMENNRPKLHIIEPLEQFDGTRLWIDTTKLPLADKTGRVYGILGVYEDITDRKRAEEEVRLLKHSIDVHYDGAYWMDSANKFVYVNDAACKALGYNREELIGKTLYEVNPMANDERMKEVWTGLRQGGSFSSESIHRRKDGSEFPVEIVTTYVRFGGKEYLCGFARDITERRKLEDQFRQSQKMESIGTLAGGVAHDFNNILTAISGYGYLTLMKMADDDPLRQYIRDILESTERAANLTRDLLLFSRKQPINRTQVDLNERIQKLGKFLVRVIGEDISFKTILSGADIRILADSHQLDQVLMNLASNARDAMPKGGVFTITTEQVLLSDERAATLGLEMPGRYALITVSDTGLGMNEETAQRIFEPFFTTKEVGKGTGLGLAVVYGIVKQHDGSIKVYSEPGHGTAFEIYLPVIEAGAAEEKEIVSEEPAVGGKETILLAEDDMSVREMTQNILRDFGYTVITAVDGEDAVKKFTDNKDSVRLLLFDLIMPRKTGKDAYDEIRVIRPDIKVIFASGYDPDMVRQKALLEQNVPVVYKPVPIPALLKIIRRVLDEGEA